MTKQEKITLSKAIGRFRYLIIDANDKEYCVSNTFYYANKDGQACKGEVWLNGKMVMNFK